MCWKRFSINSAKPCKYTFWLLFVHIKTHTKKFMHTRGDGQFCRSYGQWEQNCSDSMRFLIFCFLNLSYQFKSYNLGPLVTWALCEIHKEAYWIRWRGSRMRGSFCGMCLCARPPHNKSFSIYEYIYSRRSFVARLVAMISLCESHHTSTYMLCVYSIFYMRSPSSGPYQMRLRDSINHATQLGRRIARARLNANRLCDVSRRGVRR